MDFGVTGLEIENIFSVSEEILRNYERCNFLLKMENFKAKERLPLIDMKILDINFLKKRKCFDGEKKNYFPKKEKERRWK